LLLLLCLCFMQQLVSPTPHEWSLCRPTLCRPENEANATQSLRDKFAGEQALNATHEPGVPPGMDIMHHWW
jgi:hypothetical protein